MTVATVITPPTIRSAAAPHPARWTLRSATMAMLVLALALLAAGAVTDAFAQPPSPPPPAPAPAPAAIVTPPVQPAVPTWPSAPLSVSPTPTAPNPRPDVPTQPSPTPATPGPATPNPAAPNPVFPGGVDPNPATPDPVTPSPASPDDPDPNTPSTPGPADSSGDEQSGCGLSNISGCVSKAINGFFADLVSSALNPLLNLLSHTLLTTPDPSALPQLGALWHSSWAVVLAMYGLVVMASGVLLMVRETVQTRWSARELAPRLVIGFGAGAVSMLIATEAIRFANALAAALAGNGVDPNSTGAALRQLATLNTPQATTFLILLQLALVVIVLILLIAYAVRVAITIILIVAAPLALMCHALPGVEAIARWWWRSFAACLAIQVVQSLVLVTVVRVFLTPGGWNIFGPNANGLVNLIIALALMGVLAKTPYWLLSTLKIGHGRTLAGSVIRSYLTYKTLGLLKGAGAPATSTKQNSSGPVRRPRRPARPPAAPKTADPYARVRATRDGQLMLPLEGVRRVPRTSSPAPTPSAAPAAARAPRGRQLAFDFRPPDPYRGIRAGRDGQYPLPITVTRVRRTSAPAPAAPTPSRTRTSARERGQQLAFEFTPPDPYARLRPLRNGQYPLPIRVARVRPAPTASTPPQPPTPAPAGRQLHLPLPDLPVRRRTRKGGSR